MTDLSIQYKMHYFKIEGRQTEVTRCLAELKQPCPACVAWRANNKSSDPGIVEMAKAIAPSDKYLFNVIDLNNVAAGIQRWGANYTCWDKVMEIAANPAWGNVVDPANGVNFEINMTPASRSRTGWNQYSVMPEPMRTTVMQILEQIPNWQQELDRLEESIEPAKEATEITQLLADMGFASQASTQQYGVHRHQVESAPLPAAAAPAAAAVPAPLPVAPAAAAAPAPVAPAAVPAAAPVSVPAAAPVSVPQPAAAPAEPPRPNVASVLSPNSAVHYDPGAGYTPKFSAAERPAGAPACFGDYEPRIHRCQDCPVVADCQLKLLDG